MSNKTKQAFPGITIEQRGDPVYNAPTRVYYSGMTLRDYFAAKAMQGYIMRWSIDKKFEFGDPESVSKMSYEFADAMLQERDK